MDTADELRRGRTEVTDTDGSAGGSTTGDTVDSMLLTDIADPDVSESVAALVNVQRTTVTSYSTWPRTKEFACTVGIRDFQRPYESI